MSVDTHSSTGGPVRDSVTHQVVHVDFLQRAWEGGLRLMTMLAVNNEFMCGLPGLAHAQGRTCRDMEAVDLQLQAAKALEASVDNANGGPGQGWYKIVYSPEEAAGVIAAGKLAVILGIEVDYLFSSYLPDNNGFVPPGLTPDDVRAAVQHYFDSGVRYVFPIHFADNVFGGTGLQNGLQVTDVGLKLDTPIGELETPYVLRTEDGSALRAFVALRVEPYGACPFATASARRNHIQERQTGRPSYPGKLVREERWISPG